MLEITHLHHVSHHIQERIDYLMMFVFSWSVCYLCYMYISELFAANNTQKEFEDFVNSFHKMYNKNTRKMSDADIIINNILQTGNLLNTQHLNGNKLQLK